MGSYVVVPADKAKEMAEKTLVAIKKARDVRERLFINGQVKEINEGVLCRLGLRKQVTYEQVLKREVARMEREQSIFSHLWTIRNLEYGAQGALARRVLAASRVGDPVHLTLEDLEDLNS